MAESTVGMYGAESERPQDLYNFSPPLDSQTPVRSRDRELARRRLSLAGIDITMQSQRAEFRTHQAQEGMDIDARPAKRRQGASKSFSAPRPSINGLRASFHAAKENAKQRFHTVSSSKKRASSHDNHDVPMLQRTRSLFGLRPNTSAAPTSHLGDDSILAETQIEQESISSHLKKANSTLEMEQNTSSSPSAWPQLAAAPAAPQSATFWSQFPGAAARQSAREFGKNGTVGRSRDDSAFGEHRRRSKQNRESGISLAAEMDNLQLDGSSRRSSVPDIPRDGEQPRA